MFRDELDNKKSLEEYEREFSEKDIPKFLIKKKKKNLFIMKQLLNAFLKKGFNESTCKAYSFENKTTGVYDKPCNVNEECPFYKK